jgi:hypothetical protein
MEPRRTLIGPGHSPWTTGSSPVVTKEGGKPGGDEERGQDHEGQTDAKLSGAAHTRRVAGAAIACAHRFGLAGAVRLVGIVPLLRQQALPPGAHMLRRRPGSVRLEALVPQEGQAQDAAAGMEPARAPEIAVTPRAAKPAPRKPLRGASDPASRSCVAPARRRCTAWAFWVMSAPNCAGRVLHGARRSFFFPGQLRCLAP